MPTAGEYQHVSLGIPCQCCVRRRINRSLGQKSCLRNGEELRFPKALKTVSFDPVLRIRTYQGNFGCNDYQQLLPDTCVEEPFYHGVDELPQRRRTQSTTLQQPNECVSTDDLSAAQAEQTAGWPQNSSASPYDWSLCDTITSFFGFHKVDITDDHQPCTWCPTKYGTTGVCSECSVDHAGHFARGGSNGVSSFSSCDHQRMDFSHKYGRVIEKHRCSADYGRCQYADDALGDEIPSPKNRPQDESGWASKMWQPAIEDGCEGGSPTTSSRDYGGNATARKLWSTDDDRSGGEYSATDDDCDASSTRECCGDTGVSFSYACDPSTVPITSRTSMDAANAAAAAVAAASVAPPASSCNGDRISEKPIEDICMASEDQTVEYDSASTASTLRQHIESRTLDRSHTVLGVDDSYFVGKHKIGNGLQTTKPCPMVKRQRTSQMSPDWRTIVSGLYDIKFSNKCAKTRNVDCSGENSEFETNISANVQKIERSETSSNPKSDSFEHSIMDVILRMTPAALFWTGCAFLVSLIYIILFSCIKDHQL